LNGVNAGTNSPSFNSGTLANGDQVKLLLTSSMSCAVPATVNSNTLSFTLELTTPAITAAGNVLSVTCPVSGAIYSWEKEDALGNWLPVVPAATGTSYTVSVNGKYRAKGTKGVCTLNSNSISLTVTAVSNPNFDNIPIHVFPNPVHNELWIDSLKLSDKWETLDIFSNNGQPCLHQLNIKGLVQVRMNTGALPPGVYLLILRRLNGRFTTVKFVKM